MIHPAELHGKSSETRGAERGQTAKADYDPDRFCGKMEPDEEEKGPATDA